MCAPFARCCPPHRLAASAASTSAAFTSAAFTSAAYTSAAFTSAAFTSAASTIAAASIGAAPPPSISAAALGIPQLSQRRSSAPQLSAPQLSGTQRRAISVAAQRPESTSAISVSHWSRSLVYHSSQISTSQLCSSAWWSRSTVHSSLQRRTAVELVHVLCIDRALLILRICSARLVTLPLLRAGQMVRILFYSYGINLFSLLSFLFSVQGGRGTTLGLFICYISCPCIAIHVIAPPLWPSHARNGPRGGARNYVEKNNRDAR